MIDFEERSCEKARVYFDDFLSNELSVETRLEVLRHLERCQGCTEALDARRRVKTALKRAVEQEGLEPAALRERIRKTLKPTTIRRHWPLAVAAGVMLALGGWVVTRGPNLRSASDLPSQASLNEPPSERSTDILNIGLSGHVDCALRQDFSAGPRSFEQMSRDLGPDYVGLVPLVKDRVPQGYTMMAAHRCSPQGRDLVHLILTDQQTLLSLVLTKKDGESFGEADPSAVLKTPLVPLYRAHSQDLEVAGFETRDYLAYVVSGLAMESNLQIASSLAPLVNDFLTKLLKSDG